MFQADRVEHPEPESDKSKPVLAEAAKMNHPALQRTPPFNGMLQDAEHLLNYAVEAGIEVDPKVSKCILAAITAGDAIWNEPEASELAAAITKLAAKLKPVTAETLRACREDAHKAISSYKNIALPLAFIVVVLSFISFISAGISNQIKGDIRAANEYLVTLHSQVDASKEEESPSPSVRSELQKFAVAMRSILSHSRQLKWFSPFHADDPCRDNKCQTELVSANLKKFTLLKTELDDKTRTYQEIREFASGAMNSVTLIWGAIGNFILPVLYALLGACAAVLRAFSLQLSTRTFAPTSSTPRFYIAGIGGAVVGLFNDLFGQHPTISPLALAFLVGYSTDIFFSFLEGATQNLTKAKASS